MELHVLLKVVMLVATCMLLCGIPISSAATTQAPQPGVTEATNSNTPSGGTQPPTTSSQATTQSSTTTTASVTTAMSNKPSSPSSTTTTTTTTTMTTTAAPPSAAPTTAAPTTDAPTHKPITSGTNGETSAQSTKINTTIPTTDGSGKSSLPSSTSTPQPPSTSAAQSSNGTKNNSSTIDPASPTTSTTEATSTTTDIAPGNKNAGATEEQTTNTANSSTPVATTTTIDPNVHTTTVATTTTDAPVSAAASETSSPRTTTKSSTTTINVTDTTNAPTTTHDVSSTNAAVTTDMTTTTKSDSTSKATSATSTVVTTTQPSTTNVPVSSETTASTIVSEASNVLSSTTSSEITSGSTSEIPSSLSTQTPAMSPVTSDEHSTNLSPTSQEPTTTSDPCLTFTCENSGTCSTQPDGTARCSCAFGYIGANCSEDINECSSSPCKNGGNCTDNINNYTCTCEPGYTGTNCQTDIDECSSNPCQHGATCNDKVNGYTCACIAGYSGNNCQTDIDECLSTPCVNGNCTDQINGYTCTCELGYTGVNCETDIDDCMEGFCQNGGTCVDGIDDYTCQCTAGWKGKNCTDNIDECSENTDSCHRNANCTDTQGSYNCTCKTGFEGNGRTCNDVNECIDTTRCKNEAFCFNTPGSYRCHCELGWAGDDCSEDIDECAETKHPVCDVNADCMNTNGSYTCTCQSGYRGDGRTQCIQEVLIATNGTFRQGDDDVYGPIPIPNVVYYYGKPYNTFYVSMNGYLTLGRSLNQSYPPSNSSAWRNHDFPIIAPLWSDIETLGTGSGVAYQIVSNPATLDAIKTAFNVTSISQSIVVTWKHAVPYPISQNGNQRADFQAVVSTSGTDTLVMFNYDQAEFTWTPTEDKHVIVGLSDRDFNGDVKFTSNNFSDVNNGSSQSAGIKGRWIFNVTSTDIEWTNKLACQNAINSMKDTVLNSNTNLENCPCDERQVKLDRRFKLDTSTSSVHSYITRFSKGSAGIIQRCNYGTSGYLIKGSPNGGYTDTKSPSQVKFAHDKCCTVNSDANCMMFYNANPSDTCTGYSPPSWAPSWGDPHITTLDGLTYAFNGRGEYVLFKANSTQNITVQVRTDLFSTNSTDATVFVGVAIKVGEGPKVEMILNRTTEQLSILGNGVTNGTFPGSVVDIVTEELQVFNYNNKLIALVDSGLSIQMGVGNILDIIVSAPNASEYKNSYGLLGNNNGNPADDLIPSTGNSAMPVTSSEQIIFKSFGQTWKVTENESLFTYFGLETYEFYNNKSIEPSVFLSDIANLTANLTDYISSKCGRSINVSSCDGNPACLVDTAASCNVSVGVASKATQETANMEKTTLDHKPPVFTLPESVYIGYNMNTTLNLTFSFTDVALTVTTNITNYDHENSSFVWNVTDVLRTSTMSLHFVATDSVGASSEYSPNIYYCGCELEDQCDFTYISIDGPIDGKFYRARCNCPVTRRGDFCELDVDRCTPSPCYPGVSCNNSNTDICGECPSGYMGDGTKCYDVNECYTNTSKCDQHCDNTVGSYICSCNDGYVLQMDNHTCTDVDECLNTSTCSDKKQYCSNTVGSYECLCRPGFASDNNGTCYDNQISFAGVMVFEIKDTNHSAVRGILIKLLEGIFTSSVIDIVSLTPQSTNSRKRRATDTSFLKWKADYIIHKDVASGYSTKDMEQQLIDYFDKHVQDAGSIVPDGVVVPMRIKIAESKVYSDTDGGVCNFPDKVKCDDISTHCNSSNGIVTCSCKAGFATWENPDTSCKDIDECAHSDAVCAGGTCTNLPGSFQCTCQGGYSYKDNTCIDMCQSSPCGNGGTCVHGDIENQYLCKCDDLWTGTQCEEKNSEAEKLKIIAITVGASVGAICLILLCMMFGMHRRNRHKYGRYSSRPLSGMDFDSTFDLQPTTRNKEFPIDDSDNTTFSIPRPKVTENVYESTASSVGASEEPNKPLTEDKNNVSEEGHDNPSFLHSKHLEESRKETRRTSRNPYEYF